MYIVCFSPNSQFLAHVVVHSSCEIAKVEKTLEHIGQDWDTGSGQRLSCLQAYRLTETLPS